MKRVLFLLHLTPINFFPALIASLHFKVIYWKPVAVPKLLRRPFERANISDYISSDEWQIEAENAFHSFDSVLEYWNEQERMEILIRGKKIDFSRQWVQWLARSFEEHHRFFSFIKSFCNKHRDFCVNFGDSFLTLNSEKFAVQFRNMPCRRIVWFGWLDFLWHQLSVWIAILRSCLKLCFIALTSSCISNLSTIRFVFSGISQSEFASEEGKLDFSFLVQRNLLGSVETLYVLPKVPAQIVQQHLKRKAIQWCVDHESLLKDSLQMRLLALKELLSIGFNLRISQKYGASGPVMKWMAVKALPWVLFVQQSALDCYAASQSASWPEESSVSVMNSFQVRTVSWFYSTNSFGILKDEKIDFKDKSLENGIWVSNEAWVWNQAVKTWLENRMPAQSKFAIKNIFVVGSIMCGNYNFTTQKPYQNDKLTFINIFDVPALSNEALKDLGLGPLMYNPDITNQFYQDIMGVLEQIQNVGIIIKPKRPLGDRNREYPKVFWDLVNSESSYVKQGRVVVLPNDIDPYLSVSKSRFFIGLPFTSPVFFGLQSQCRLLFHDPLGTFRNFVPVELKSLITTGEKELVDRIKRWLASKESACLESFHEHAVVSEGDPALNFVNLLKTTKHDQKTEKREVLTARNE